MFTVLSWQQGDCKGPFIETQLNSTQRRVELCQRVAIDTSPMQLNSTRFELSRYIHPQLGHDVQNSSVTVVHAVNVSTTRRRVELRCYRHFADATQLHSTSSDSTRRRVELSCVIINGP